MGKNKTTQDASDGELVFEQALERLEQLVERLEAGQLSLEGALRDYEQGMQLVTRCRTALDRAEQRVRELRDDGADPTPVLPAAED